MKARRFDIKLFGTGYSTYATQNKQLLGTTSQGDYIVREVDSSITNKADCDKKSGYSWDTGSNGASCLANCPDGYRTTEDSVRGMSCVKKGSDAATQEKAAPVANTTTSIRNVQQSADAAAANTDVFSSPPAASSDFFSDHQLILLGLALVIGIYMKSS